MVISWTSPANGASPILDYRVYWDQGTGLFVQAVSTTYGQTTYIQNLPADQSAAGKSFNFQVTAVNLIGEGQRSNSYLVVAATTPDPPQNLARNGLYTTLTVLSFTWSNGASTGGSPVIGYNIYFDQGVGTFIMLTSGVTT